ncbi:MAG: RNA polymerase sigma factor, partial [Bacteroidota bacterium]
MKRKRKAQYVFYKCYFPYLYAIGYRYTHNRETTLEMVNLGFAKIMLNLHQFDPQQSIKTWMKTILVNVIIDEFRKTKRYQDSIQVVEDNNLVYLNASTESQFGDNLIELIQEKLKTISPMSRDVFNLYAIDGYKHKEIA